MSTNHLNRGVRLHELDGLLGVLARVHWHVVDDVPLGEQQPGTTPAVVELLGSLLLRERVLEYGIC